VAPCYGSTLGLNPDIHQKFKVSDTSERVAEILQPGKKINKKVPIFSIFSASNLVQYTVTAVIRALLVRQASRRGNLSSVHKEKDHFSTNLNTKKTTLVTSLLTNQSSKIPYENGRRLLMFRIRERSESRRNKIDQR
jgi:hypothetical protein